MPFVKEKTYMKWTKKDHPIRKNFNYFFNNPIWQNTPPEQFSLCPFFWMSMFGLFGLKLCLVPIWRLSSLLAAGTLGIVDKGLYHLWKSGMEKYGGRKWEYGAGRGFCPSFVAIFAITMLHIVSQGLGALFFDVWHTHGIVGRWGFFGFNAIMLVWTACGIYHLFTDKIKEDRCRVEWYGIVATVIWLVPWCILGRVHIGMFFMFSWALSCDFCSWIASLFAGGGSTWGAGIVLGLIVFYLVAVIVDRAFYKIEPCVVKKWELTRDMIVDLMAVHLSYKEGARLDRLVMRSYANGNLPEEARMSLRRVAARALLIKQDTMSFSDGASMKIDDIIGKDIQDKDKTRGEWEKNFAKVCDGDTCYGCSYYSSYYLEKTLEDTYNITEVRDAVYDELKGMKEFVSVMTREYAQKTQAQKARDERCRRTLAIVSAPFRFIGSLFSYCWDVFKAKKEGFCPLLTLEPMENGADED